MKRIQTRKIRPKSLRSSPNQRVMTPTNLRDLNQTRLPRNHRATSLQHRLVFNPVLVHQKIHLGRQTARTVFKDLPGQNQPRVPIPRRRLSGLPNQRRTPLPKRHRHRATHNCPTRDHQQLAAVVGSVRVLNQTRWDSWANQLPILR